jgi:hypothetical protein
LLDPHSGSKLSLRLLFFGISTPFYLFRCDLQVVDKVNISTIKRKIQKGF